MLASGVASRAGALGSASALNGRANPAPKPIARRPRVAVRAKKADPPDVPKARDQRVGGGEWLQSILSRFGPVKEKASNTTVLDFEKPLVELDNRIKEVRPASALPPRGARAAAAAAGPPPPPRAPTHPASHASQVRQVAEENGVDVSSQIKELEERAKQVRSQEWVLASGAGSGGAERRRVLGARCPRAARGCLEP